MSGKYSRTFIPDKSAGGAIISSQADIAKTIASSSSMVCNSENYDHGFRVIKENAEAFSLNLTRRVAEAYNTTFSMNELLAALERCRNRSAGPGGTHNEMLSHHPQAGSFCCPYTIVHGRRGRCLMPGKKR
jgi:hypothetical protein